MPSKPIFSVRTLFRELELRFFRNQPLPTPDHLGYYLTFWLLDHPLDESWMLLLDDHYKIVDSIQVTEGILAIENMLTLRNIAKRKQGVYYCLAHTHSDYSTEPSHMDMMTHRTVANHFAKDPEYLGSFILNQALDYRFFSPSDQEIPVETVDNHE